MTASASPSVSIASPDSSPEAASGALISGFGPADTPYFPEIKMQAAAHAHSNSSMISILVLLPDLFFSIPKSCK